MGLKRSATRSTSRVPLLEASGTSSTQSGIFAVGFSPISLEGEAVDRLSTQQALGRPSPSLNNLWTGPKRIAAR